MNRKSQLTAGGGEGGWREGGEKGLSYLYLYSCGRPGKEGKKRGREGRGDGVGLRRTGVDDDVRNNGSARQRQATSRLRGPRHRTSVANMLRERAV